MNEIIKKQLTNIIGTQVSSVSAGAPTGSIFYITFMKKFSINVECSWRLSKEGKLVTGWREPNHNTGQMTLGIKSLTNDVVVDFSINNLFDLQLRFESGKVLDVFCDITPNMDDKELFINWAFNNFEENYTYEVTYDFKIDVQKYDTSK